MSRLFVTATEHDYIKGYDVEYMVHNPKVNFICRCPKCGEYGTRNQYGRDDYCPKCGEWLDWNNEEEW